MFSLASKSALNAAEFPRGCHNWIVFNFFSLFRNFITKIVFNVMWTIKRSVAPFDRRHQLTNLTCSYIVRVKQKLRITMPALSIENWHFVNLIKVCLCTNTDDVGQTTRTYVRLIKFLLCRTRLTKWGLFKHFVLNAWSPILISALFTREIPPWRHSVNNRSTISEAMKEAVQWSTTLHSCFNTKIQSVFILNYAITSQKASQKHITKEK